MNTLKKLSTSIVAIIIAFWLFFPLGFILLYLRISEKHGKFYAITKILFWTGIIWTSMGIIYIGCSVNEQTFITEYLTSGIAIFIIPGLILFFLGNKKNKKMKIYNKYLEYINSRSIIRIDELCNYLTVDYDTVLHTVTEMIDKELIDGHLTDDKIILNGFDNNSYTIQSSSPKESNTNKPTKVVKCPECGAKNTVIIGTTKECEYCGTLLQ